MCDFAGAVLQVELRADALVGDAGPGAAPEGVPEARDGALIVDGRACEYIGLRIFISALEDRRACEHMVADCLSPLGGTARRAGSPPRRRSKRRARCW